jgi:hypothetical protein
MADPVSDAKGGKLGEVTVIKDEDEVTLLITDSLNGMGVAARKEPDVARTVVDLTVAVRIEERDPAPAGNHIGPLGGSGVPVQLAQPTGHEAHRNSSDPLGDRKLRNGRFFRGAAFVAARFLLLHREAEARQRDLILAGLHIVQRASTSSDIGPLHGRRSSPAESSSTRDSSKEQRG